ncbi:GNAT family protein [Umezawaea sp. Da 62-37]|uniref:GNAT family N-acetyltransferase n=1 Tax=Umezawaea sp. Da 62-37 TaxID=3075927 RepID=UPI0028F6D22F|nr:GNAT family protein [Umezawaea sp. Da 62-37]WNV91709.1 GNAT family protein [Umezawaea sp. Da 62-37]
MTTDWFDRPVLTGPHVRLEPLTAQHAEGLLEAGEDPDVWKWLADRRPTTLAEARAFVDKSLNDPNRRPWAQLDPTTGEVAGVTSYHDVDPVHRAVHIGHTWIGTRWQRTGMNTNAKLLLIARAFDDLGAHRVGWHTDMLNTRSRAAIERLGATFEGALRAHRVRPDGTLRDTAVYSVTAPEWPSVRAGLTSRNYSDQG